MRKIRADRKWKAKTFQVWIGPAQLFHCECGSTFFIKSDLRVKNGLRTIICDRCDKKHAIPEEE